MSCRVNSPADVGQRVSIMGVHFLGLGRVCSCGAQETIGLVGFWTAICFSILGFKATFDTDKSGELSHCFRDRNMNRHLAHALRVTPSLSTSTEEVLGSMGTWLPAMSDKSGIVSNQQMQRLLYSSLRPERRNRIRKKKGVGQYVYLQKSFHIWCAKDQQATVSQVPRNSS